MSWNGHQLAMVHGRGLHSPWAARAPLCQVRSHKFIVFDLLDASFMSVLCVMFGILNGRSLARGHRGS